MKTKTRLHIIKPLLILIMLTTLTTIKIKSAYPTETTTIQPNPTNTNTTIGENFTITMTVTNVTNLNAWQLQLAFNPQMLYCTEIYVPPENIFTPYTAILLYQINNTEGTIRAFCALEGTFGINGSGVLSQIKFQTENPGITSVNIITEVRIPYGTYLQDPNYNLIPYQTTTNATVTISGPNFQQTTFNITQNQQTYQITILTNSTITNFNYDTTLQKLQYDATGTDGTTGLSSIAIPKELLNGIIATLINEEAIPYNQFENQTHNFLTFNYPHTTKHIKILTTIFGDISGDRTVDMLDISIIIYAFMTTPNNQQWNPLADVNKDNMVDMADLTLTIQNFMKTWSP